MKAKLHSRRFLILGLLAVLAGGIALAVKLGTHTRSTDNAYLNADVLQIAAEVGGRVSAVHVGNNQTVTQGTLLFELDAQPYRIALARTEADLAQALLNARQDDAALAAARARLQQTTVELEQAKRHLQRAQELVARQFTSAQALEDATATTERLRAAQAQARADLARAEAVAQQPEQRADVQRARAEVAQAKLDLARTRITAAQPGYVSNLSLTPGEVVTSGAPLFALVATQGFHVDANFKETELPGIHPGQSAEIEIDMYPGERFAGTVESLSGGTGTAFSLLPPQNATGNWVKIAQRIPVRIALAPTDPARPLRIGASASVTIRLDR